MIQQVEANTVIETGHPIMDMALMRFDGYWLIIYLIRANALQGFPSTVIQP
jgi:hypothetical protein